MKHSEQIIAKFEEGVAAQRLRLHSHAASIDALAAMLERSQTGCKIDGEMNHADRIQIFCSGNESRVFAWLLQAGFVLTSKLSGEYDHCYLNHPELSCGVTLLVPIPSVAEAA